MAAPPIADAHRQTVQARPTLFRLVRPWYLPPRVGARGDGVLRVLVDGGDAWCAKRGDSITALRSSGRTTLEPLVTPPF